jgi:two-component sensor histidine kinase
MALHELTTNAVKYGALSVPSGRLRVEWSRGDTHLVIQWSETDGPPVEPPRHQGFGTRVVNRIIQSELEGTLRFEWNPAGLACEITIPVEQIAGSN